MAQQHIDGFLAVIDGRDAVAHDTLGHGSGDGRLPAGARLALSFTLAFPFAFFPFAFFALAFFPLTFFPLASRKAGRTALVVYPDLPFGAVPDAFPLALALALALALPGRLALALTGRLALAFPGGLALALTFADRLALSTTAGRFTRATLTLTPPRTTL